MNKPNHLPITLRLCIISDDVNSGDHSTGPRRTPVSHLSNSYLCEDPFSYLS